MGKSEVREWTVYINDEGKISEHRFSGCDDLVIKVIEKSAFEQLQNKLDNALKVITVADQYIKERGTVRDNFDWGNVLMAEDIDRARQTLEEIK